MDEELKKELRIQRWLIDDYAKGNCKLQSELAQYYSGVNKRISILEHELAVANRALELLRVRACVDMREKTSEKCGVGCSRCYFRLAYLDYFKQQAEKELEEEK